MTGGFNRWTHDSVLSPMKMLRRLRVRNFSSPPCRAACPTAWGWLTLSSVAASARSPRSTTSLVAIITFRRAGHGEETWPAGRARGGGCAPIAKVQAVRPAPSSAAMVAPRKTSAGMVEVVLPKYQFFNNSVFVGIERSTYETHRLGWPTIRVEKCTVEGLQCFFIEAQNGMFQTDSVYGRNDDSARFNVFCNAALEFLTRTARQPDILHCHDWSSAEVARSYWEHYHHNGLTKPKVAFTIHNMNYGQAKLAEAVYHSQMTTTVSPSYAGEVSESSVIGDNGHKFTGIHRRCRSRHLGS